MASANNFSFKSSIHSLNAKDFKELLEATYELMKMQTRGKTITCKDFDEKAMFNLFIYLVLHLPDIDQELLEFIAKILGIDLRKFKEIAKEEELEEEQELSEDLKLKQILFITYEFYKIVNPNQLAGERPIENFINNVQVRGISKALKHNPEFKTFFTATELDDLSSYRHSFVKGLEAEGQTIGGKGLGI